MPDGMLACAVLERQLARSRLLEREMQDLQAEAARHYHQHHIQMVQQHQLQEQRDRQVQDLQCQLAQQAARAAELLQAARTHSVVAEEVIQRMQRDNRQLRAQLEQQGARLKQLQHAGTDLLVDVLAQKMQHLQLQSVDLSRGAAADRGATAGAARAASEPAAVQQAAARHQGGCSLKASLKEALQHGWHTLFDHDMAMAARERYT